MQIIKPSYEIIEQLPGIQGMYDMIESAGRTCYKSEGNITLDVNGYSTTSESFVNKLIEKEHYAMLEHGTVYLKMNGLRSHYDNNPYSKINFQDGVMYITTNYRVIVENGWQDDLKFWCGPTQLHYKRYCVKLITDRGVTHEAVRQRKFSFAQESSRYCNYSKDKFSNEVTFVLPPWFSEYQPGKYTMEEVDDMLDIEQSECTNNRNWCLFLSHCAATEQIYFALLRNGQTPQQARQVLNNALKTELIMTGYAEDWQHFFDLRSTGTTGAPHPSIKELADPLYEEFKSRLYV